MAQESSAGFDPSKLEIESCTFLKERLTALGKNQVPQFEVMGFPDGFDHEWTVGKTYRGKVNDDKFEESEIITWENTKGEAEQGNGWQWMGWKSDQFLGERIRFSFWIKFVGRVPKLSRLFGFQIYGRVYNDFVVSCAADVWSYVEVTLIAPNDGTDPWIGLVFNSIPHKQVVRIAQLQLDVLGNETDRPAQDSNSEISRSHVPLAVIQSLVPIHNDKLQVLGFADGLVHELGVGRTYVGNLEDSLFFEDEIITWENTKGYREMENGHQRLGWYDETNLPNDLFRFQFWIKFIDKVPEKSDEFGVCIFGNVFNSFLEECEPNKWLYIEKSFNLPFVNDTFIGMIFNSIDHVQVIRISQLKVDILDSDSNAVKKSFVAFPSSRLGGFQVMGYNEGFDHEWTVGKAYLGNVNDDIFDQNEILTWENIAGHQEMGNGWQWFGWHNSACHGCWLKFRFWIKFVDRVPNTSRYFGIQLCGKVYNNFVTRCRANEWCYVEETWKCPEDGDDWIGLVFNSIPHLQKIHISQFQVDILDNRYPVECTDTGPKRHTDSMAPVVPMAVAQSLGALNTEKLQVLGCTEGLVQTQGVGRTYISNAEDAMHETFPPCEILTWENVEGQREGEDGQQSIGWIIDMDAKSHAKHFIFGFWIKFIGQVPTQSEDFGLRIFGNLFSDFLDECEANKWCYVDRKVEILHNKDKFIGVVFNSIDHQQIVQISQLKVHVLDQSSAILKSLIALPSDRFGGFQAMGYDEGLDQEWTVGKTYLGNIEDDKFDENQILTWENIKGVPETGNGWQWIGWCNPLFHGQWLKIRFWIKCVGQVPKPSQYFGIQLCGKIFNSFVRRCKANEWCYVQETLKCSDGGDPWIGLVFNSISHLQKIHLAQLYVDILVERPAPSYLFLLAQGASAVS